MKTYLIPVIESFGYDLYNRDIVTSTTPKDSFEETNYLTDNHIKCHSVDISHPKYNFNEEVDMTHDFITRNSSIVKDS